MNYLTSLNQIEPYHDVSRLSGDFENGGHHYQTVGICNVLPSSSSQISVFDHGQNMLSFSLTARQGKK